MKRYTIARSALIILCLAGLLLASLPFSTAVSGQRTSDDAPQLRAQLSHYEILRLDAAVVARQVRQTGRLSLDTAEGTFDLSLAPHDVRAGGFRAERVTGDGEVRAVEPAPTATYKGSVRGMKDAHARFTIDGQTVEGLIIAGGQKYFVEPASRYATSAARDELVVYKESDVIRDVVGECRLTLAGRVEAEAARAEASASKTYGALAVAAAAPPLSPVREVELATEADFEYFQAFGSAQAANNEIASIVNMIDGVYETEIGLSFRIVFQRVWETPNDPYNSTSAPALLTELQTTWNTTPPAGAPVRDLVHLWTGKQLDTPGFGFGGRIGVPNDGVVCLRDGFAAYSLSQRFVSLPAKYLLPAHEIGHNFGATHPDQESPARTECANTIMSSDVTFAALTFCQFSRDQIVNYVNLRGTCLANAPAATPTVQFNSAAYRGTEGIDNSIEITVTRSSGDGAATVFYETTNQSASDRSDYNAALGTLTFAAGETSKKFIVFITNDVYQEGVEAFGVSLSNVTGATLGTPSAASVSISDDDPVTGANPVKPPTFNASFFVRQHYVDFFNREPDAGGLGFWVNQTTNCGNPDLQVCRDNVSAAFFVSGEFQQTGYLVYRFYQAAFGRRVQGTVPLTLREFLPDTQEIGRGYVGGQPGSEQILEQNKQAYANRFVARADFLALYPSTMSAAQFVDTLNANTGGSLSQAERDSLVNRLNANQITRAQALREIAEDADLAAREFNRAFVLMQYFGYLRRNPYDAPEPTLNFAGYNFWLGKLNEFGGNYIAAQMVRGFIVSGEYEQRFGPS